MDTQGFRAFLKTRNLSDEQINASIAMTERFEAFIAGHGKSDTAATLAFCQHLVQERENSYGNLLALARYGLFIQNNAIYLPMLELIDGAEVHANLYQRVGERYGEALRDEVFAGIGVAPLGTPSAEKPKYMFPVLERLIEKVGQRQVEKLLSACLRDLPEEHFREEQRQYKKSKDIDAYAQKRHRSLLRQLRNCQREGKLFFSQEVNDEVVAFVKNNPEIESGVRVGNVLFVSKIPYNTIQYLAETDPTLKRYYVCHCPWAREAILHDGVRLNPTFCNCSGGYSKKPWEVLLDQTLEVEVLESALKGDFRCRFAIHLPENIEVT
jgi:hypothetical protein